MIRKLRHSSERRHGFTLIELLIVIAIIAILTALLAVGVFAMIGSQHSSNTQSTMRVVNKLLQDRWSAVVADAKKEDPSAAVKNLAGPDAERAKAIWIKVRLVEAFPIRYAETQTATSTLSTFIPAGRQKPYFSKYKDHFLGKTGGGPGESAACLLMALKTLPSDGIVVEDQLKHAISDTDGVNAISTLIDGWGNPVAFFRFPWNNAELQAANPAAAGSTGAVHADSVDKGGKFLIPNWYWSINRSQNATWGYETFQSAPGVLAFHPVSPPPTPNTAPNRPPNAYYTLPIIASAGRDGVLDLAADFSVTGNGAKDNILSFKLTGN